MPRWITRFVDLREDEARPVVQSFLVLFFLIAGHTTLETARDALFLTELPPNRLNLVYIALAGLSFVVAAGSTRVAQRFGRRNALIATLCVAAFATVLLHAMAPTPRVVMALYVFSGLVGAVLSPQFWLLAAQMFTSAQGRRLFGPIASGGVVGGVAGAGSAALLLSRFTVTSLLLVAAFAFVGTALLLTTLQLPLEDEPPPPADGHGDSTLPPPPVTKPPEALTRQPFVWRVALLVALSTAAVLTVDYLFKSTAAHRIPAAKLGEFFARYYALMNGVSLVVQLFVASRVVRRLGVAGATGVTPGLLLLGGIASFVSAGALLPVMAMRMIDGGLRYSLNRVATELLYLPIPTEVRERAKSLIDTVLARSVQALTAAVLLGLSLMHVLKPHVLALIIVLLCAAWVAVTVSLRAPYLDLFRRALASGKLRFGDDVTEIDINAAEALVEAMASPDPVEVIAALNLLEQRHRSKLIPALILHHDAEAVLVRALDIFGAAANRSDWIALGERLLADPRESVRVAAVRALAKHGVESALARGLEDFSSTVQAYSAFYLALGSDYPDLADHPRLAVMVRAPGPQGDAARRILLTAIADAADPRSVTLVLAIAESRTLDRSDSTMSLLANAMEALLDPRFIPFCIKRLGQRPGRESIRRALIALGVAALGALEAALLDPQTERRIRTHIPRTIADFGTQRACDFLVARLADERDGLVRYKVLRGLGHIVAERDVKVDRSRIDAETRKNLVEHLRLTALCVALEADVPTSAQPPSERCLIELLHDKVKQSLERAFRLLKIAHKREDIHRVNDAALSTDKHVRSNAGEFLDTLLAGRGRSELRELFRLVIDDLTPRQRIERAGDFLKVIPHTRDEALAALIDDRDEAVVTLASYYALSLGAPGLRAQVERARKERPSLAPLMDRFFGHPAIPAAGTA